MKRRLIASLAIATFGLVACSKAPSADGAMASSASAPAEKRMPLPDCSKVETEDKGPDGLKHPDCRLQFTDKSGFAIEARYAPAEDDATKITVQVVSPGDATLQTITETMGNTFAAPSLIDIDGDGRQDVQLPLETGNANTSWAIWRQMDDGKAFIRIGEPNGVEIKKTDSGYIAVPARSAANEWEVSFFKLTPVELKPILTADIVAKGEPDKITGTSCTVMDDGGLASIGMDPKAAEKAFCAEPVVANAFK
ncbi:MAG TPA: hypothetical protein VG942_04910 [Hyphomonadaceae bacterium]|nr:hypothetical protein [Hyphomonadaceae bacterium]